MNLQTLLRLERNPHYKLSAKQKAELAQLRKKPMVPFGKVPTHNQGINIHDNKVIPEGQ